MEYAIVHHIRAYPSISDWEGLVVFQYVYRACIFVSHICHICVI